MKPLVMIEAQKLLGGQIGTVAEEGSLLEEGADSFADPDGATVRLCAQLGIADRVQVQLPRALHRFVRVNGVFFPIPDRILDTLSPRYLRELAGSPLLSQAAKHRLSMEAPIPPAGAEGDKSIAHFAARRLGPEVAQTIVGPLVAAFSAGDPAQLSVNAVLPQLRALELRYKSLSHGMSNDPGLQSGAGRCTLPGGLSAMVGGLESRLRGVRILTGRKAASIRRSAGAYEVLLDDRGRLPADVVVCAIPAYETAALIGGIDAPTAGLLRGISYASTTVVHLGYLRAEIPEALDGYGYVVRGCEDPEMLSCARQSCHWTAERPQQMSCSDFRQARTRVRLPPGRMTSFCA